MARPRVVVVGAGFAGFQVVKTLTKLVPDRADVVLVNPTDYSLYLPLLPEVSAGVLDPRRVAVSLPATLPGAQLILGDVDEVDLDARTVGWTDPEGNPGSLTYDHLVIAAGSVNKLLPIPGLAEHAHGFRGIPEALYLRDHMTRQVELAAATDDQDERTARTTFVVVGAGYTGTEIAAQGVLATGRQMDGQRRLAGRKPRWLLLDTAQRVLPELDERLGKGADKVLRERGVEVRTGTSVAEATAEGVRLTDGEFVPTRSLIWCVGVRPEPLAEGLDLELTKGRLVVDEFLRVPGHPGVYACGDVAAVPDLTRPGEITPMTAQHAERQGKRVGRNLAADLGRGRRRRYKHHDLGFVVDLGGWRAVANPLGVPLTGLPAYAVTRGYHLLALHGNRARVVVDWVLDAVLPRQAVQLGLVRSSQVPLDVDKAAE